ncbi:hypothetical protein L0337_00785 [candidate division KSB1 bacterium]|nr:hypothetical protein [candidate division KSB1 bacterium]
MQAGHGHDSHIELAYFFAAGAPRSSPARRRAGLAACLRAFTHPMDFHTKTEKALGAGFNTPWDTLS